LQVVDANISIANQVVGIQEYGVSNTSLIAGLETRGATVEAVKIYGWEFPEDTSLLQENIRAIATGERDVLLVTSAHQIVNMLRMADQMRLTDQLRDGLRSIMIASIGPTTSQMLIESDLQVDFEPSHPKLGQLVNESAIEAARRFQNLSEKGSGPLRRGKKTDEIDSPPKGQTPFRIGSQNHSRNVVVNASRSPHAEHPSHQSLFLRACRGEATSRTPVWLMRQAGRYMVEYRQVRDQHSFLELCHDPQLCSEVMCTAVDRLGVDAAIIFSDLLPILVPLGLDLEFAAGDGPVIHNPISGPEDVKRIRTLNDPNSLDFVYETVRRTRNDLPASIPVIGFAGAPFTLASYAIEGGGSRQYLATKRLMYGGGMAWSELMEKLSQAIVVYLNEQIRAGAQCVQLFDSWVGCLSPGDYAKYVAPWMREIISRITAGIPVINFATGNPELLPQLRCDDRTVVGVDWRISLDEAWKRVGYDRPIQGNLDPAVLLAAPDTIRAAVAEVLTQAGGRPGHIFNLGHGVHKETPVDHVIALVKWVKELSEQKN
jgi:uroporphyrinogen decarboxylase